MDDQRTPPDDRDAEDLLRSALIDEQAAIAMALKVDGLALARALTVVFHGRPDLGTIQTYVANGRHGEGQALTASDLLRVPCDLDLGDAQSRDEAEEAYLAQARALRDALVAADTVLAVWHDPLRDLVDGEVHVQRSTELDVHLPAPRVMPLALVAPERCLVVTAVCGARSLADGRPPLGIVCAQQGVAHVYPLPDDPEACLDDFASRAADHARATAHRLGRQEQSVRRFLELNGGDDFADTA